MKPLSIKDRFFSLCSFFFGHVFFLASFKLVCNTCALRFTRASLAAVTHHVLSVSQGERFFVFFFKTCKTASIGGVLAALCGDVRRISPQRQERRTKPKTQTIWRKWIINALEVLRADAPAWLSKHLGFSFFFFWSPFKFGWAWWGLVKMLMVSRLLGRLGSVQYLENDLQTLC